MGRGKISRVGESGEKAARLGLEVSVELERQGFVHSACESQKTLEIAAFSPGLCPVVARRRFEEQLRVSCKLSLGGALTDWAQLIRVVL